jgi:hypothetical protein
VVLDGRKVVLLLAGRGLVAGRVDAALLDDDDDRVALDPAVDPVASNNSSNSKNPMRYLGRTVLMRSASEALWMRALSNVCAIPYETTLDIAFPGRCAHVETQNDGFLP